MSKRKLLLADDSITIQKVVNLTFADEDIEIIIADNGDAAMRKFVENLPDLVMIDVNLSELSGFDICEMIKQDDATRHIPVVLLVGAFEKFDETKARQVGADDFLTKPFPSIRQLVETVTDLFEGKRPVDKIPPPSEESINEFQTFKDILEVEDEEKYDSADVSIESLGEFIGTDDQIIQTFPNADLREPEVNKFESFPITDNQPVYESYKEKKNFYDEPSESEENKNQTSKSDNVEFDKSVNRFESSDSEMDSEAQNSGLPENFRASTNVFEEKNQERQSAISLNTMHLRKSDEIFSPEVIDAIAAKVAEKLSTELIEKVVRETIEQMERKK